MKKTILLAAMTAALASCQEAKNEPTETMQTTECSYTIGNVTFTKMLNATAADIELSDSAIVITAAEKTDLFCDPNEAGTVQNSPMLITEIDNTRPFTFTACVRPAFTSEGTYAAGAIMPIVDLNHWQKLCYEQSEDGLYRVVTVRTIGHSDDNNHQQLAADRVWLRISSDTRLLGNYYSEDGQTWHLVRIYKNEFPATLPFAISSQSPKKNAMRAEFTNVELVPQVVKNFREGAL